MNGLIRMLKSFKTEINPTEEQKQKIHQTIGVCRFLYNRYLHVNKQLYEAVKHLGMRYMIKTFISGYDFDKYINNVLSKQEGYEWIKEVSSKARKKAIMNAETAYKKFFNKQCEFPQMKKKSRQDVSAYFPNINNGNGIVPQRHIIKILTLGNIRLKEKGYIPTENIKNCTISYKGNRYYVSVMIDVSIARNPIANNGLPIGIDLGIKDFAIVNDGKVFKNINKTTEVKKTKRRLKRQQRRLSRKYYNHKKGEGTNNIKRQVLRVQKLHYRLTNIRKDYIRKTVNDLVKTKPEYIVIEDLNVKGMMKNRCLSKAIGEQGFGMFRVMLTQKCKESGIQLRIVDKFYPSSKTCSKCGNIKKQLSLSNRTYICEICGLSIDRDLNASINLVNAKEYTIIT